MYEVLILRINKDTWSTSTQITPYKEPQISNQERRTVVNLLYDNWEPVSMQEIIPGVCTQWVFKKLMVNPK